MLRQIRTPEYNLDFRSEDGFLIRWGKIPSDDPKYSPIGPEILDIEVSTVCSGIFGVPCVHCYKSNTFKGKNMSFDTFKQIFDKMPGNLTQIAFGIGDIDANPDLFKMFAYCRAMNVVPNITINGARMTEKYYNILSELCGAVAVSRYNRDICYDAVQQLVKRGMKQVNIHMLVSEETYGECFAVMKEFKQDPRLKGMYAIVFLLMKPKGDRNVLRPLTSTKKYKQIVDYGIKNEIPIGFDSCSAPKFLQSVRKHEKYKQYTMLAESCESSLFSSYINVDGRYWHCSFVEDVPGWKGVDVLGCRDFLNDVWYAEETKRFRNGLIYQEHLEISKDCRFCPVYDLNI